MGKRYRHWFWNSVYIRYLSRKVGRLHQWLWHKMYERKAK